MTEMQQIELALFNSDPEKLASLVPGISRCEFDSETNQISGVWFGDVLLPASPELLEKLSKVIREAIRAPAL